MMPDDELFGKEEATIATAEQLLADGGFADVFQFLAVSRVHL